MQKYLYNIGCGHTKDWTIRYRCECLYVYKNLRFKHIDIHNGIVYPMLYEYFCACVSVIFDNKDSDRSVLSTVEQSSCLDVKAFPWARFPSIAADIFFAVFFRI